MPATDALADRFRAGRGTAGSGVFLQISDVHLDLWYNASFGRECFCNEPPEPADREHCRASATNNPFGQHGCDSSAALMHATLRAAAASAPEGGYDWVLLTGDYSRHHMSRRAWPNREAGVQETVRRVVSAVERYFPRTNVHHSLGGHVPFVLGNNDFDGDYNETVTDPRQGPNPWLASVGELFSAEFSAGPHPEPTSAAPAAQAAAAPGERAAAARARSSFARGGYFVRQLTESLYLVSLNTVMYSTEHRWAGPPPSDPFGQLRWLRRVLDRLRRARRGSTVEVGALIVGHIPPVVDHFDFAPLWLGHFAAAYGQIVVEYDDVIAAQLFAHMHCDTFRLLPSRQATYPLFIASAVSPIFQNNPSFRVWTYKGARLLDFAVHGAQLNSDGPQGALVFKERYRAREAFGLASLAAAEWRARVVEPLARGDARVWARYVDALYVHSSRPSRAALLQSRGFRARTLCAVENFGAAAFAACMESFDQRAHLVA